MKLPAVRSDDAPGVDHCWTRHEAAIDGFTQGGVRVIAGIADVADRSKSRRQHILGVHHAFNRSERSRVKQRGDVIAVPVAILLDGHAEMRVRVEHSRKDSGFREVDDCGIGRNLDVGADRHNVFPAHHNDLIGFGSALFRVDKLAGFDGVDLFRAGQRVLSGEFRGCDFQRKDEKCQKADPLDLRAHRWLLMK